MEEILEKIVARDFLISIYSEIENDPFLSLYYQDYHDTLANIKLTYNRKITMLSNITTEESFALLGEYLKEFYPAFYDYYQTHYQEKVVIYDRELLYNYINKKDNLLNYDIPFLTIEEARDLLIGEALYNSKSNLIMATNYHNLKLAFNLLHEYTHLFHFSLTSNYDNESFLNLYSEYLAYLNSFYFQEYLETLGYSKDTAMVYRDSTAIIEQEINIFKLTDKFYQTGELSSEDFAKVSNALANDNIPLFDYEHIVAYLMADYNYKTTREKSLTDRCIALDFALEKKVNKRLLREIGLDLQDKRLLKRL